MLTADANRTSRFLQRPSRRASPGRWRCVWRRDASLYRKYEMRADAEVTSAPTRPSGLLVTCRSTDWSAGKDLPDIVDDLGRVEIEDVPREGIDDVRNESVLNGGNGYHPATHRLVYGERPVVLSGGQQEVVECPVVVVDILLSDATDAADGRFSREEVELTLEFTGTDDRP